MMFQVFEKTDIDFIGKRYLFFTLSGMLMLLGVIALVQISRGKANLGIDFAGGAAVQLKFNQPVRIDDARKVLEEAGMKEAELQTVIEESRLLIRVKKEDAIERNFRERIQEVFAKGFPGNEFVVESSTEIGPTIGQQLQKDALFAVAISMLGIILYIAFRFEFRFGIAAAIATFHDVLAVLGIFYVLNKEINLLVITALLTLAGYSLSDTVVVFDRIRENLKTRKKESLDRTINRSINEVLSRTFITGVTTFLAVVALFFFGGNVIHDFSLALILGVIIGTYSSWFIASPLLLVRRSEARVLKRA
jgi:preprotein translocase subunit SecF